MRRREFLALACAAAGARAATGDPGAIAYVQTDGLWVRKLPDGAPKKLLNKAVENPRFSPSGEWIAYNGGVVGAAGGEALPLPEGEAVWLPDRDALAVSTGDRLSLFEARNNWQSPRLVRIGASGAVFGPDGSQFAYETSVENGKGPGGEPMRTGQLGRAPTDDGSSQTLASQYLMGFNPYAWTSDSRYILYWADPDFSVSIVADGAELFRVPTGGGKPRSLGVSSLLHRDLLSLAPNGNLLAVTVSGGRETWTDQRIAVVDVDTLALRYLTDRGVAAMGPAWSPDGQQIAYTAAKAAGHIGGPEARAALQLRRIWLVNAFGPPVPRPSTSDPRYRDEEPLWSADGTHILFCRMDSASTGTLWLMGSAGEDPVRVSGPLDLKRLPPGDAWFGYYGYIDWRRAFDWHRPAG